jgi:hypothetical protein
MQLPHGAYTAIKQPLTLALIAAHIRGALTLGAYALDYSFADSTQERQNGNLGWPPFGNLFPTQDWPAEAEILAYWQATHCPTCPPGRWQTG